MGTSLRQRVMFILFAVVLLAVLYVAAFVGDINIVLSNLYLLLFLAALYLDRSENSKMVLVLSAAVLIVNIVLSYAQVPQALFTMSALIDGLLYASLYFFAMAFLKGGFRDKTKVNLIIILALPALILNLLDFSSVVRFAIIDADFTKMFMLAVYLIDMVFPLSIILYSLFKSNRIR